MLSGEKSDEEVLAVRCASDEKTRRPTAREPGLLQGFDLTEMHERGELVAFVDDGFGIGGSGFEGLREDIGGELFQVGGDCRCCLRHVLQNLNEQGMGRAVADGRP